uniref:Uncharacterized protein n=1 Tax=Glossina brevipalpis TaxID=37001 RepID=A0A1A9W1F6_9MUSC
MQLLSLMLLLLLLLLLFLLLHGSYTLIIEIVTATNCQSLKFIWATAQTRQRYKRFYVSTLLRIYTRRLYRFDNRRINGSDLHLLSQNFINFISFISSAQLVCGSPCRKEFLKQKQNNLSSTFYSTNNHDSLLCKQKNSRTLSVLQKPYSTKEHSNDT